ncbi:MAG: phenylalanine--tRNA ligase subunit alpha [Ostreibacterium sp.]
MEQELQTLLDQAQALIEKENYLGGLDKIRIEWLGKKGFFAEKMRDLSRLSKEDKPKFGQMINDMKKQIQTALSDKKIVLEEKQLAFQLKKERLDVTMPARRSYLGSRHPISITREKIEHFFTKVGFITALGPEIEDDFHNFQALNIAKDHPARAMQDTFYVKENTVLRTHTSTVQIRTMENQTPPLRMIAPGRVYRSDSDITHTPMFHQIEGMWIDENVSFADLKGILIAFLRDFFDNDKLKVRFRPSYFPFTEPSAEVDIECSCKGEESHCRICGETGWLEVLGSGMMHPKVLQNSGVDSEKYQGYAFGMGVERLAMLRYKVGDLRTFFENDVRFLNQFK